MCVRRERAYWHTGGTQGSRGRDTWGSTSVCLAISSLATADTSFSRLWASDICSCHDLPVPFGFEFGCKFGLGRSPPRRGDLGPQLLLHLMEAADFAAQVGLGEVEAPFALVVLPPSLARIWV